MHTTFEVVHHRDIYRILVSIQVLGLLKGLVLEVEAILTKLVVVVTGDTVTSLMYEHGSHDTCQGIEYAVGGKTAKLASPQAML